MNFSNSPPKSDLDSLQEVSSLSGMQHLDLSAEKGDDTLAIHLLEYMPVQNSEMCGKLRVFDFEHVYASEKALLGINRAHVKPLYLVEAFAHHYCQNLFRELTRGNEKGRSILDPSASTYRHSLANGGSLVVNAETVKQDDQFVRRLNITFEAKTKDRGVV